MASKNRGALALHSSCIDAAIPLPSRVMVRYPKWLFALVPGLIVLHLNYWMWDDTRLVFGLPINLLYHIFLCASLGFIMRSLVSRAWPSYLDEDE